MTEPTDDELLRLIEAAETTVAVCTRNIKKHKATLLDRREKEIQQLLKAKDEPFGDVTIVVGNHKAKVNIPKKVTYNQELLRKKYQEILASGESPDAYIKVEYDISENAYKAWTQEIKAYFLDARTVAPGNPTVKIMDEE